MPAPVLPVTTLPTCRSRLTPSSCSRKSSFWMVGRGKHLRPSPSPSRRILPPIALLHHPFISTCHTIRPRSDLLPHKQNADLSDGNITSFRQPQVFHSADARVAPRLEVRGLCKQRLMESQFTRQDNSSQELHQQSTPSSLRHGTLLWAHRVYKEGSDHR